MRTYTRMWSLCVLLIFYVLCFKLSEWIQARQFEKLIGVSDLEKKNAAVLRVHPVMLLRTHREDALETRFAFPVTAIVLPMTASASIQETMHMIQTLSFYSYDSNLRFYIGTASDKEAKQVFNIFHNLTLDNYSQEKSGSQKHRYVEVVVLRIPDSQHGRNRLHALLVKAWSELNDYLLVLHGSCVISNAWSLPEITNGGIGYSMISVSDRLYALQIFEEHIHKIFDHLYLRSKTKNYFKCTEGIVQALRMSF